MSTTQNRAVRAIDIAISFVEREEQRLRAVIESEDASGDNRFRALQDLAYLSGIVVRELADIHSDASAVEPSDLGARLAEVDRAEPRQKRAKPRKACREVEEASFHKDVCDNLSEGVYFVDKERKITYWNQGAHSLTGFQRDEAVGRHCFDNFLQHKDECGRPLCHAGCPLAATLKDGKAREAQVSLRHKAGHRVPVSVRVSPVVDHSGTLIGAVEVFSDVTSHRALERRAKELEELAYVDALTGLSNRRHIELKLQQAIEEVDQFDRKTAVLLLDIDGFKRVNDTYGHSVGDTVLKAVGERLAEAVRPPDAAGRWGGEEFLLVMMDVDTDAVKTIAERCKDEVGSSVVAVNGDEVRVTVSVGAAPLKRGDSPESIIRTVDKLLYVAKSRGGNAAVIS